jgi:hypothetical protein
MSKEKVESSPLFGESQRSSLKSALGSAAITNSISPTLRQVIREICGETGDMAKRPELLLIAFKACLNEAASDANIPIGPERNALIDRLVSVFIEELYRVDTRGRTTADGDHQARGTNADSADQSSVVMPPITAKTPDLYDAHP